MYFDFTQTAFAGAIPFPEIVPVAQPLNPDQIIDGSMLTGTYAPGISLTGTVDCPD